jgi:hypothetical protein
MINTVRNETLHTENGKLHTDAFTLTPSHTGTFTHWHLHTGTFTLNFANQDFLNVPPALETTMFTDAYRVGARIHTNSWGANSNSYV